MYSELIDSLRQQIIQTLAPIVSERRCVLLDVPYYSNIGDTLIWHGTENLLREVRAKVLCTASKETFDFRPLPSDVIILLQGGGNFGDLWFQHQLFRRRVIENYPKNHIVILPQTVYFNDKATMQEDAAVLARHDNLTICARDKMSLEILNKNYSTNNILLLPDMAFCCNLQQLRSWMVVPIHTNLFFKRTDKEIKETIDFSSAIPQDAEEHEWPAMEAHTPVWQERGSRYVIRHLYRLTDWYWRWVMRPFYVKSGVRMISSYKTIYTTRLHGAILSVLLGKPITFFDNSYGKNRSFHDTWLSGAAGIKFVSK